MVHFIYSKSAGVPPRLVLKLAVFFLVPKDEGVDKMRECGNAGLSEYV